MFTINVLNIFNSISHKLSVILYCYEMYCSGDGLTNIIKKTIVILEELSKNSEYSLIINSIITFFR